MRKNQLLLEELIVYESDNISVDDNSDTEPNNKDYYYYYYFYITRLDGIF